MTSDEEGGDPQPNQDPQQGAGQEGGEGVVQPLHEAPVPHTGRGRQDCPHPLGGLVNTQSPQDGLLVSAIRGQPRQAVLAQHLHHLENITHYTSIRIHTSKTQELPLKTKLKTVIY